VRLENRARQHGLLSHDRACSAKGRRMRRRRRRGVGIIIACPSCHRAFVGNADAGDARGGDDFGERAAQRREDVTVLVTVDVERRTSDVFLEPTQLRAHFSDDLVCRKRACRAPPRRLAAERAVGREQRGDVRGRTERPPFCQIQMETDPLQQAARAKQLDRGARRIAVRHDRGGRGDALGDAAHDPHVPLAADAQVVTHDKQFDSNRHVVFFV
jgi:hypothetical protein